MGKPRMITHMGVTLTMTEWANRLGISKHSLSMRFKLGWEVDQALSGAVLNVEDANNVEAAWPPKAIVVQGAVVDVPKMRTKVKDYEGLAALKEAIKRDKDSGVTLG